ncbi:MAG: bacillithiol biosynthesis deacetylase BshB1 [Bacteroidia bacterium]|nr:bacillithiol biosynthesis deacetylase BshB1 [Bacteroidia bacterium]
MKLDILVLAAHPDDAELGCGGTIAAHVNQGKKVGIIDFTRGELGSRGTPEIRDQEAKAASQILGLAVRENLEFEDGFLVNNREHQLKLIEIIRRFRPEIVLASAVRDRHIDHGRAALIAQEACFLSGLVKIMTYNEQGEAEEPWRPKALYHYIQDYYIQPDLVVDVTPYWSTKMDAVTAYSSQFYSTQREQKGRQTPISTLEFIHFLEGRAREMGRSIGVEFGEGFTKATPIGVRDLLTLF